MFYHLVVRKKPEIRNPLFGGSAIYFFYDCKKFIGNLICDYLSYSLQIFFLYMTNLMLWCCHCPSVGRMVSVQKLKLKLMDHSVFLS